MKYRIIKGDIAWKSELVEVNLSENIKGIKIIVKEAYELLDVFAYGNLAEHLNDFSDETIYMIIKKDRNYPFYIAIKSINKKIYDQHNFLIKDYALGKIKKIYDANEDLYKTANTDKKRRK